MNNAGESPFNNESNPPAPGSYWLVSPSPPSSLPPQLSYQFVNTPSYPQSSANPSSPSVPFLSSGFGPTPAASGAESSSRSPNAAHLPGKLPIPRITGINQVSSRRRSARACESCRHRKIKCDGKKPACGQCVYHKARCVYEDVKRVRDEKQIKSLTAQVGLYEKTLRSLEAEVDGPSSRKIRRVLKRKDRDYSEEAYVDDSDSSSSVGSLEAVDVVSEDLNRSENARASGYFGKNSEISWIQKLEDNAHRSSSWDTFGGPSPDFTLKNEADPVIQDIPIAAMNYHLDDLNIPALESNSEPTAIPLRELADEYLNAYMTLVNPFFSAVRKSTFEAQYVKSFNERTTPPRKWLAILNMIFAIGCRHCRMMNPDDLDAYDDDMVFMMRARQLSFNENTLFEHTTLQQIQLEFLLSLYLLCVGQLNRASKLADMALHSAISLGVNLRFMDGSPYDESKEARCRLWWSIYSLQHILTSMHGRASSAGENLCCLPLPIPANEEFFDMPEIQYLLQDDEARDVDLCPLIFEKLTTPRPVPPSWVMDVQPSPSLFFHYLVDLSLISQSVLNKVYSIEGIREGTTQKEYRIKKYGHRMDHWLAKLPSSYQFNIPGAGPWHLNHSQLDNEAAPHTRERVSLAMNYFSARITLCRPCLSLNYSRSTGNSVEKTTKAQLRAELATNCLQASCALISIFPEQVDLTWLARVTPMWSALHFLMQSTTALLLGLSYCSLVPSQNPMQIPSTVSSSRLSGNPYPSLLETDLSTAFAMSKKAVGWMHTMAALDPTARRACVLCDDVVRRIAPALKMDLSDWPIAASLVDRDEGELDLRMDELDDLVNFEAGSI